MLTTAGLTFAIAWTVGSVAALYAAPLAVPAVASSTAAGVTMEGSVEVRSARPAPSAPAPSNATATLRGTSTRRRRGADGAGGGDGGGGKAGGADWSIIGSSSVGSPRDDS